jgi:hypothetical protein
MGKARTSQTASRRASAPEQPTVTRDVRVGGGRVVVLDGVLTSDAIGPFHAYASRLRYRLDAEADDAALPRTWRCEVDLAAASRRPFTLLGELTRQFFPRDLVLRTIRFDLHQYGDAQPPERGGAGGVTFLLYVNEQWDSRWMGETVFYEEPNEPSVVVLPRPGRAVIFDSAILHRAGVAHRECFEPRIGLTLHFARAPARRSR